MSGPPPARVEGFEGWWRAVPWGIPEQERSRLFWGLLDDMRADGALVVREVEGTALVAWPLSWFDE